VTNDDPDNEGRTYYSFEFVDGQGKVRPRCFKEWRRVESGTPATTAEGAMADINTALAASRDAIEQLIVSGERTGPTPADGRARLEAAHQTFDEACRRIVSQGDRMRTTVFGAVPVEDYVRFMELHTRHHERQMTDRR
jgi:hypothetical protein